MASEQASSRGAERAANDDVPYAGVLGRTRSEVVHVLMPDGSVRSVDVYVGIDAASDPALAALARAGTLHHVAPSVELALPFLYHDALARVFALVVPEGLRHRALALRAEHMLALAGDTAYAPPSYVREVEVVIGAAGLVQRLERGVAEPLASAGTESEAARVLAQRERELARRERVLEARERALRVFPARSLTAVHESDIEELAEDDGDEAIDATLLDEEDEDAAYAAEAVPDEDEDQPYAAQAVSGEYAEIVELAEGEAALEDDDDVELVGDDRISVVDTLGAPPDVFVVDSSLQLWLSESQGRVWAFVRPRPSSPERAELLLQLDPSLDPPVVLVTLVFDAEGTPDVRRGVIDPFVAEQSAVLYLLAQHYEIELATLTEHGIEHMGRAHAPREGNARAVLAQVEHYGAIERDSWEEARDALLAAPPPWRDLAHPFQSDGALEPPLTATEAAVLLDELSDWLSPERRARVRLLLCIPDRVVDASYRAGIGYALDWGLSLSRELLARALELGIAKDEAALLARRIEGLCRASRESDFGGLEQGVLRAEWSDALEQAAHLGVTLSDEALELARRHAGERALVHANALADTRDEALEPVRRRAFAEPPDPVALEELIARGGYRDVLDACRLTHKLAPQPAAALFARAARRGDPVALDALLSLLSSGEQAEVRAGAALALGSRRALNALDELVTHVASEDEPAYRVFALALGRYGAGSFRAITRALKQQGVEHERAALVLAHLALHGARAQVRARARARERKDAQLAERALTLASAMKEGKNAGAGLEQQGSLTVFCELFDLLSRDPVG